MQGWMSLQSNEFSDGCTIVAIGPDRCVGVGGPPGGSTGQVRFGSFIFRYPSYAVVVGMADVPVPGRQ